MPPTTSRTVPGFWRCTGCNTPNPSATYLTKCLGCGRPIPPYPTPEPSHPPEPSPSSLPVRGRKTLAASVVYGVIVLGSVGMIRGMGLGWWLVAALLFFPRWLFLAPILPLLVGAIRARRKWVHAVVVADLFLVLGPLRGFVVPIDRLVSSAPTGSTVRVMTFNVAARRLDGTKLLRSLERHQVDVVCFQEPNSGSDLEARFLEAGWHFGREGRIVSRFPIVKDLGRARDETKPETRESMIFARVRLRHPDGFTFLVGSAHLPTPRRAFDRLWAGDVQGFRDRLAAWDEELLRLRELMGDAGTTPLIVGGDFNMPVDYQRMASLRSTYPSGFDQSGWGYGYTRPTGLPWVRIDHVVASQNWAFTRSWLGPDLGSDHLPLITEAVLVDRKPGE